MTRPQNDHQQEQALGQGYTHKKFNCGYSHKKLGLRLRKREPEYNESIITLPETEQINGKKPCKDIFRPYALDESNTPRKRKLSRTSESFEENTIAPLSTSPALAEVSSQQFHQQQKNDSLLNANTITVPQTNPVIPYTLSSALSANSYNMRLQRQRAALYMHYMCQIQQQNYFATLQTATGYPIGYPNVTAPIFNGC